MPRYSATLGCQHTIDLGEKPIHLGVRKDGWYSALLCPECKRRRRVVSFGCTYRLNLPPEVMAVAARNGGRP